MKKEKLELKIRMIMDLLSDWCEKKNITFIKSGNYSLYISIGDINYEEFKEEILEYIKESLSISKKKLKNLLSILYTKSRTYILFKTTRNYSF